MKNKVLKVLVLLAALLMSACNSQYNPYSEGETYCIIEYADHYAEYEAKYIEDAERIISLLGHYDIVRVVGHPQKSDIFIVETRGHWHHILYLVVFNDNVIQAMDLISEAVCTPMADFIFLEGIDEYFLGFFHSSNMGNGGYKLFDFRTNTFLADVHGVFDEHGEAFPYPVLQQLFGEYEFSFVFENGALNVRVLDIDGDGFSDLKFYGAQQIFTNDGDIVHYEDCVLVFIYNPVSREFELSEEHSIFTKFWEYNWNAIVP